MSATPRFAATLSTIADPPAAADECAERLNAALNAAPDLLIVAATPAFTDFIGGMCDRLASDVSARHVVATTAAAVCSPSAEIEARPGISVLAGVLPGVDVTTFTGDTLLGADMSHQAMVARIAETVRADDSLVVGLLLADPFSVPVASLIPALNDARLERTRRDGVVERVGTIFGGLASGGASAGANALVLDGAVRRDGAVGVALHGPVRFDAVVSQGCRPFGPAMLVTQARGNLIMELGGRPAMAAINTALEELDDADRRLLSGGLFLGKAVSEYRDRFGRGDFLVRNVIGADAQTGAVAVNDLFRVGQTVRMQLRDKATAAEDLALLLDGQQLHPDPLAALVVTCNSRTQGFFGSPAHDARAVADAFAAPTAGAHAARAGREIDPAGSGLPVAGFFASGEIGPVGGESHLHGHTACVGLFRAAGAS